MSGKEEVINDFIKSFEKEDKITIQRDQKDEKKAKELSQDNYPDALHVILAKKANAIYLVTRNVQDFAEFQNLIEIVMPESL